MKYYLKIILCIILFFSSLLMSSCGMEYAKDSGWNRDIQNFDTKYVEFYKDKVAELKEKYSIDCVEKWEQKDGDAGECILTASLYSDSYTICLLFANRRHFGDFEVKLYYYGENEESLSDYESQRPLVSFINDLTKYVAFDNKIEGDENHFERLYNECHKQSQSVASYIYHFDDLVGYVGYGVGVSKDNYGYYYKMEKNSELEILANSFVFEGLLKPISSD